MISIILYIFRKIKKEQHLPLIFLRTSIALLIELSFYPKLSYIILLQFICSLMISRLHDYVLFSSDRNVPSYAFWHYFGVPLTLFSV